MDGADLVPFLEKLEENIDDLEETLEPLLQSKLSDVTKTFPLLDKAKLHVLITYSIESLLFSYLRLHGVNAREHPVYTELTRLQQYFAKIEAAGKGPAKRENMSVNVPAVDRILKHDLVRRPLPSIRESPSNPLQAGNEKLDLERAEQQAKQRAAAQLKLRQMTKKRKAPASDDDEEATKSSVKVAESTEPTDANSTEGVALSPAGTDMSKSKSSKKKKRKRGLKTAAG